MVDLAYILPHSEAKRCLDRFSILDIDEEDDGLVPFWQILEEVLKKPVNTTIQLIDVLDTISNTLRGSSGLADDYGMLKKVVDQAEHEFFQNIWPKITRQALSLPELFPHPCLAALRTGDELTLSHAKLASLVSHQFLCTLDCPDWRDGYYDFSIWYGSGQRHPAAAEMYLSALFEYFRDMAEGIERSYSFPVSFKLNGSTVDLSGSERASLTRLSLVRVPQYSTNLQQRECQGPNGAIVVSANKDIGFGESATQEEMFVGSSPEVCPAVLFTPTLQDNQALLIQGATPMITIRGQRRDISWETIPPGARQGGRMLFMDALEMDELDQDDGLLPDLKLKNMEREIGKAFSAFSSYDNQEGLDGCIWSGLWGCGAFNGDPVVKMALIWIAASLSRKEVSIVCDPFYDGFATALERFAARVQEKWNTTDLWRWLSRLPKDIQRLETLKLLDKAGKDIVEKGGFTQ